jgi:serine/threonine-protein kinase
MAYELLAGERPFDADHPMALLHAHLTEEPARPEGMPGSAWRLLRACLAKDPAERPDAARLADSFVTLAAKLAGRAPLGPLPAPPDGASRQRGWQAEPAAAATRGGAGAALATSASELPPPPAPAVPEPPRRGGWRVLLAVLLAAAIVGGGTGILLARSRSGGSRHGGPPATAGPGQGLPYAWVPVTASSPRPGTIVLRFGGGGVPAGLQSYAVLNDGHPIADALAASASRYTVSGLQPGAVHCFSVIALLATPAPTDAGTRPPKPTCRRADGRPTPR